MEKTKDLKTDESIRVAKEIIRELNWVNNGCIKQGFSAYVVEDTAIPVITKVLNEDKSFLWMARKTELEEESDYSRGYRLGYNEGLENVKEAIKQAEQRGREETKEELERLKQDYQREFNRAEREEERACGKDKLIEKLVVEAGVREFTVQKTGEIVIEYPFLEQHGCLMHIENKKKAIESWTMASKEVLKKAAK